MLGVNKAARACLVLLAFMIITSGCGAANRSAEEWLTMSTSGLEGMDQYSFAGQSVTALANGETYSPKNFEGKVVDHKELATSTNKSGVSPSELLKSLQTANKEVTFGPQPADANLINLQVNLSADDAKKQWSDYVWKEFEQVALNQPAADAPYKAEWDKELERSRKELESRLSTLTAQSSYTILVDRNQMIPVEVNGTTVFDYSKQGGAAQETRKTNITLSGFNTVNTLNKSWGKSRIVR